MKSIQTVLNNFIKIYKDVPGLLEIKNTNNSIICFIDNNKFKTKIPHSIDGVEITFYDVRNILDICKLTLSKNKVGQGKKYLIETVRLCESLLANEIYNKP